MALTNRILDLVARKRDRKRVLRGHLSSAQVKEGQSLKSIVNGELFEFTKVGGKLFKNKIESTKGENFKSRFDVYASFMSKPSYDSGWNEVSIESRYDFKHHLGSEFLMIHAFLRLNISGTDRIFPLNNNGMFDISAGAIGGGWDRGFVYWSKDRNTLQVATGNDYVFLHDNTELSSGVSRWTDGELRLFIWKIVPGNLTEGSVEEMVPAP